MPGSSKRSFVTFSRWRYQLHNGHSMIGCLTRHVQSLHPFVKLARTIRTYRASIEATIEWKLTNGIAESNNAAIGRIRANARGFHDPESFITMIMQGLP